MNLVGQGLCISRSPKLVASGMWRPSRLETVTLSRQLGSHSSCSVADGSRCNDYSTHVGNVYHYSAMTSQIYGVSIVYSNICSGADQKKHQSSASLAFVRGIHRWPVNSPHKGPVTRKIFPFDDVIMRIRKCLLLPHHGMQSACQVTLLQRNTVGRYRMNLCHLLALKC